MNYKFGKSLKSNAEKRNARSYKTKISETVRRIMLKRRMQQKRKLKMDGERRKASTFNEESLESSEVRFEREQLRQEKKKETFWTLLRREMWFFDEKR